MHHRYVRLLHARLCCSLIVVAVIGTSCFGGGFDESAAESRLTSYTQELEEYFREAFVAQDLALDSAIEVMDLYDRSFYVGDATDAGVAFYNCTLEILDVVRDEHPAGLDSYELKLDILGVSHDEDEEIFLVDYLLFEETTGPAFGDRVNQGDAVRRSAVVNSAGVGPGAPLVYCGGTEFSPEGVRMNDLREQRSGDG